MSAYVVEENHINYLVHAALNYKLGFHHGEKPCGKQHWRRWENLTNDTAGCAGQMLWDENILSVSSRYQTNDIRFLPPWTVQAPLVGIYTYKPVCYESFNPYQIITSCQCLEYQSCEHEGWARSKAKLFLNNLISTAVDKLPAHLRDTTWGAPEPMA